MNRQHADSPMPAPQGSRGFSLIEVMVALIVLSVGLLGVARMQSLAMSSTAVASQRSMAAISAEGLASAMHANRGYWAGSDPSMAIVTVLGNAMTVTQNAPLLAAAGSPSCTSTTVFCTPAQIAAFELRQWALDLFGILPADKAVVSCGQVTPVTCTITISWGESIVAANASQATTAQTAGANAAITNSTYTLYVQP